MTIEVNNHPLVESSNPVVAKGTNSNFSSQIWSGLNSSFQKAKKIVYCPIDLIQKNFLTSPEHEPFQAYYDLNTKLSYEDLSKFRSTLSFFEKPTLLDSLETNSSTDYIYPTKSDLVKHFYEKTIRDKNLSEAAKSATREGIELSSLKRHDFQYEVRLDKNLIKDCPPLVMRQRFVKNSILNGQKYFENDNEVTIDSAITSSYDRTAKNIALARKIEDENEVSYCYAGRIETFSKAKDMVKLMFLGELSLDESKRKGIALTTDKDGDIYNFTFGINSLLSTNPALIKEESDLVFSEQKAIERLKDEIIEIKDPRTGEMIRVKARPINLLSRQFNFMNRLERLLPSKFSGKDFSQKFSKEGLEDIKNIALCKLEDTSVSTEKKQLIKDILSQLEQEKKLQSYEYILNISELCYLLEMPFLTHCKSSVDRTGLVVTLNVALKQWQEKLGKKMAKENGKFAVHKLLEDPLFKELIAANLPGSLLITEYSRGILGFKWNNDIIQHPTLRKILPDRYLRQFNIMTDDILAQIPKPKTNSLKNRLVYNLKKLVICDGIIRSLGVFASIFPSSTYPQTTDLRSGIKNHIFDKNINIFRKTARIFKTFLHFLTGFILCLILLPTLTIVGAASKNRQPQMGYKFIKRLPDLFPGKVLNEEYPGIGERSLLFES